MKDNCPVLMQSEERNAPWNEKKPTPVQIDCTVCYCISKSMPVNVLNHSDNFPKFEDVNFIEEYKGDSNAIGIPTLLSELQRLCDEKIMQLRTEGIMLEDNDKETEAKILKEIKHYQAISKASEDWIIDDLDVINEE